MANASAASRACSSSDSPLEREVSAVVARTRRRHDGRVRRRREPPRRRASSTRRSCRRGSRRRSPPTRSGWRSSIADALDYVGVLAVEMFVVGDHLVVNEIAPRPHNSGHWTLDGARTSQFEQQVRAVCGVALGDTSRTAPAVAMVNLLGDLWPDGEPDWTDALGEPDAPPAPLRQGRAPPRPQDGPPHRHRPTSAGRRRRGCGSVPGACSRGSLDWIGDITDQSAGVVVRTGGSSASSSPSPSSTR